MKILKEKALKNSNGITLIALVTTIIILLILAGISISMLSGNNGILQRTTTAKENTDNAQIVERVQLAYTAALADGHGELTETNLRTELTNEFSNNYDLSEDTTTNEWVIKVNEVERLRVSKGTTNGNNEINITTLQTTTTKPYLPSSSFSISNEPTEQTVAGGLVITDGTNEFVWVEVPITNAVYATAGISITEDSTTHKFTDAEYLKIAKDLAVYSGSSLSNNPSSVSDHLPTAGGDIPDYTTAYKNMLQSVYQNGGFWVGRYETGIQGTENATESARATSSNTSQTAVIKENVQPYNYVTWAQAQTLAQGISAGRKGDNTTSLLMGVQWDLVLKFLGKNGDTDSHDWGNYMDSEFDIERGKYIPYYDDGDNQWLGEAWTNEDTIDYVVGGKKQKSMEIIYTTGANTTNNSQKNICDFAGNVYEWTIEKISRNYANGPCSVRGGFFAATGSETASSRGDSNTSGSGYHIGFRVSLY